MDNSITSVRQHFILSSVMSPPMRIKHDSICHIFCQTGQMFSVSIEDGA